MKRNTLFDVGGDILREITRAVDTNNYSNLNSRISSKVNEAIRIGLSQAEANYRQKQQRCKYLLHK